QAEDVAVPALGGRLIADGQRDVVQALQTKWHVRTPRRSMKTGHRGGAGGGIAGGFAANRHERQRRERLAPEEFDELAAAGFLLTGVPTSDGGLFEGVAASTRTVGDVLNSLARGDAPVG